MLVMKWGIIHALHQVLLEGYLGGKKITVKGRLCYEYDKFALNELCGFRLCYE